MMMQRRRKESQRTKKSFVKVNRDAFPKIFMFSSFFVSGLVYPVGGLLLKFDNFPLV